MPVHRSSVGSLLHRLGLSHKKDLQALEQKRKDVAESSAVSGSADASPSRPTYLERLAFIGDTSVKTNMAKTTGWMRPE